MRDFPIDTRIVMEYVHRCGTLIWVATTHSELVGYQDDMCNDITVCPHCGTFIEWEGLQLLDNIENLGWPI